MERTRLSLYESMSPAFGNELKPAPSGGFVQDPHPKGRDVIYENCLKCRREHCHPPPRVVPAERFRFRNPPTFQSSPSGPHLKRSQGHEAAVDETPPHQGHGDGSRSADGPRDYEETNGRSVAPEDKRLNSREERRRADPAYEIMENRAPERNSEAGDKKYELMGSCGQQRFHQEAEVFVFPPETLPPERPCSEGVTYVNIPVSPTSKKQLNYMELELQEPGPGPRGPGAHLPAQRKSSTKYAQIDITATETAHKVGTQHALGRQEGLHTLELRRKGTPH